MMLQFALNYSVEAIDLLERGMIEVERFKCADWPEMILAAQAHRPVYIHFSQKIGQPEPVTSERLDTIERLRDETQTPYINVHMTPSKARFDEHGPVAPMIAPLIDDLQPYIRRFGADAIIVENLPVPRFDQVHPIMWQGGEAVLLKGVVEGAGVGFLLDTAHAALAADNREFDVFPYLETLPMAQLRELHITGTGYWDDGTWGDHRPMRERDWQVADYALKAIQEGRWGVPDIVALEYGGIGWLKETCGSDADVIAVDAPYLFRRVRATRDALSIYPPA